MSRATLTAVIASISTPVRSTVRAVATQRTPTSVVSSATVTPDRGIGWHSGMSSHVRLAAWMPAICAIVSTSPFFARRSRTAASASGDREICPEARASRAVGTLSDTSTMRASPASSTWVSGMRPPGGRGVSQRSGGVLSHAGCKHHPVARRVVRSG